MKYTLEIDQGTTQTAAIVANENGSFVEKNSILKAFHDETTL